MGVTTVTQELPIPGLPSSPPSDRQPPKGLSQGIAMDLVQGQWDTPGCIMKITYSDGYEKCKLVVCDHASKTFKSTVIEGGIVGDKVESVDVEIKLVDGSNPVMKMTNTYHTKGDLKLTQEEIDGEKSKAKLFCQNVATLLQTITN